MVGVALLTGLRRGELFALRWKAIDLGTGTLQVSEAVDEGMFGTPQTAAGLRALPLSPGLARASWRTFRRTYSSWAHEHGIPGKVVAELIGHAKVDTTLNVYTQVIDGAKLAAAQAVGNGLIEIERNPEGAGR
jgi:integrase